MAGGHQYRRLDRNNDKIQVLPPGSSTQRQPVRDPWSQAQAATQSFDQTARLKIGTVTDTTAYANCYRVQMEKGTATMLGVLAAQAAAEIMGAKSIGTIPPGTLVICVEHAQAAFVMILGTIPRPGTDPRLGISDFIAQTSRMHVDEAHRLPIIMPGGAINWSAGRPLDATTVGEQGWQTETGVRIFIDPFMVQLAVDEICGITGFYADQLLRIAGYNMQVLAAGHDREIHDDQGECNDYQGWTPYPHEQRGLFAKGDSFKELEAQAWQLDEPHYSAIEPKSNSASPFHRVRHYQGYLGQGGMRQIVCPPAGGETNNYDAFAADAPALLQEWLGLDGRYVLGSARGISFVKRATLLAPARKKLANDPQGDNQENYKAAGLEGDGPAHKIKSKLGTQTSHPAQERVNGVDELHAYVFNYASVHPCLAHVNDFETGDTSSLPHATAWTPDYTSLKSRYALAEPPTTSLKVDHRYGDVDYFSGEASIDITEDGSIILKSAYGSRLVLGPNGITGDAPGDITFKSGKSIINWSGQDIVARAKGSIDLTTSTKDVRIKSEKDVQVIAGNGGSGGVLIEGRSLGEQYQFDEPGEKSVGCGIVLRSPGSKIVTLSAGMYVRTGGGGIAQGDIILDAGRGASRVITHSQSIEHNIKNRFIIWFSTGTTERVEVKQAVEFTPSRARFSGALEANGRGAFAGELLVRGNILVADGHIATQQASQANGFVGSLEGGSLARVDSAVTANKTSVEKTLVRAGQKSYDEGLKADFYDDGKPGNTDLMRKMTGSLRGDDEYHRGGLPEDYVVQAADWQKNGTVWTEKPVKFGESQTYPHPGKRALTEKPLYYPTGEPRLRRADGSDAPHGTAAELADAYADPKYATAEPTLLNNSYKTIADV